MDISFDPAKRASTPKNRSLDFADVGQMFMGDVVTVKDSRFDYGEPRFITADYLNGGAW